MKKIIVTAAIIFLSISNFTYAQLNWQQSNGPYGGTILSFCVNANGHLYAGTNDGIFYSLDNGDSWSDIGLRYSSVSTIVIYSDYLYVGCSGGVYFSTNNGTNWTQVNNGLSNTNVKALFAKDNGTLYAGTFGGGVFKSTDNGTNWISFNNGLPPDLKVTSFTQFNDTLYAGTDTGGVFQDNGFGSWIPVNTGLNNRRIRALDASDSYIYAATDNKVYRSMDGHSWSLVSTGFTFNSVRSISVSGSQVIAGTEGGGVFVSNSEGASWTQSNAGLSGYGLYVYAVNINGSNFFAGTYGFGIYKSINNGGSWNRTSNGILNYQVYGLAKNASGILFAATHLGGIFRSTNSGTSWEPANNGFNDYLFNNIVITGTKIFVGSNGQGVFRSTDGGDTWIPSNTGLAVPIYSLAGNGSVLYAGTSTGIYATTTDGASWTPKGLTAQSVKAIVLSGGSTVFAGTDTGGVFRSTDSGNSWEAINNGLTVRQITCLAITGTGYFYAGTSAQQVFLSTDGGNNWVHASNGISTNFISCLAVDGDNVYAGTYGNVHITSDNGNNWYPVSTGLPSERSVKSLLIDDQTLYAGTTGSGVYKAVKELPSAPSGLTAKTKSSRRIDLSWTASTSGNPTKYRILRSTGSGFIQIDSVIAPTVAYIDSKAVNNIQPNTTYYYRVYAVNLFGMSSSSNEVNATTFASGWSIQNSGTTDRINSVKVINRNVAWAATNRVLRTTNGGLTWINVSGSGLPYDNYECITAIDEQNALVCTSEPNAYIYQTTNGGLNWQNVYYQEGGYLNAIHMYDPVNGIAYGDPVGGKWTILKTTNGGSSWYRIATEPAHLTGEYGWPNSLFTIENTHIWFGTNKYRVFYSTDKGSTWSTGNTNIENSKDLHFISPSIGISCGDAGAERSSNGGATWTTLTTIPGSGNILSVGGRLNDFWLGRSSSIIHSTDQGINWFTEANIGSTIYAMDFVTIGPKTSGWVVGDNGIIAAYSDSVGALAAEPVASPTSISFSNVQTDSMRVSFTAATGTPTGYIAIRSAGTAPVSAPVDGISYYTGQVIGSDTVAYVGSATTFVNTELAANTVYHYKIYSYNGSANLINYRTSDNLSGNRTTLQTEPTAQPTNLVFSNLAADSFTCAFTAASPSPTGYLAIRRAGSSSTQKPLDGKDYAVGDTVGGDTVAYAGSGVTFNQPKLNPSTKYYYDIFSYNGNGLAKNYRILSPLEGSQSTLAIEPANQPTNPTFPAFSTDSLRLSFTAATGSPGPSGYIILRRAGNPVSNIPQDGTTYTVGSTIGTATVAYIGSSTAFNDKLLNSSTKYYYSIFSYRGASDSINYKNTSPLMTSRSTLAAEPTAQPTLMAFSNVQSDSMRVSFTAASGVSGYIAVRSTGDSVKSIPIDGKMYAGNDTIGTDTVVYVGNGTSFMNTNLNPNVIYHFKIYSYKGASDSTNYLTSQYPLTGSRSTLNAQPSAQPTNLTFSNPAVSSLTLTYTASSGGAAGYLILKKASSSPTGIPVDGKTYSAGDTVGSDTVAYTGSNLIVNLTGLKSSTKYYFDIYAYNGTGQATNYITTTPLEGNRSTLAAEPTAQPTNITFTSVSPNTIGVSFQAASGAGGYITLRRANSPITDIPSDGIAYVQGNTVGSSVVSHIGSETSFDNTGLSSATRYYFAVFSYRGGSDSINYRTSSPLTGDTLTSGEGSPPSAPSNLTATTVSSDRIDLSWTASTTGEPFRYRIYRSDGTGFIQRDSVTAPVTVYTDSGQGKIYPTTTYYYRVTAVNAFGVSDPSNIDTAMTYAIEPTAQPTDIVFSNITNTSFSVSFTASGANQYLAVRHLTTPSGFPEDGRSYALNDAIGNGIVAYYGAGTSFTQTGLSPGTKYIYRIFASNGVGQASNYLTVNPLTGDTTTSGSVTEPEHQPTHLVFSMIDTTMFRVSFNRASGSPLGYIVLRSEGNYPDAHPADGTSYNPGASLGNARVASVGADTAYNETGLRPNTVYYYHIYSYNGTGTQTDYLTTNPLAGAQTTMAYEPTAQPSNLRFTNIAAASFKVEFSDASPKPAGYIVLRRINSAPTGIPSDGTVYTAGNSIGNGTVVYTGPEHEFMETSAAKDSVYYYAVFSYNGSGEAINYLTSQQPLSGIYTHIAPPVIVSASISLTPASPAEGDTIRITVTVNGSSPSVYLTYGKGNHSSAITVTMANDGSGHYYATIPALQVTSAGVVYRIEARNAADTVYFPSAGYASIPIRVTNLEAVQAIGSYPDGVNLESYSTVSLPLNDSIDLDNYLGSSEGGTIWRLVTHTPAEWVDNTVMRKNTAYFFYHRKKDRIYFNLQNPTTNGTGLFDSFMLKPEWNLVPWPYAFTANITSRDNLKIGAIYQMVEGNYDSTIVQFKPFGGYVIYNKTGADLLIKDALTWTHTLFAKPFEKSGYASLKWNIHFKLRNTRSRDLYNIIGVSDNALNEFDVYDDPEPISPGEQTHVYFTAVHSDQSLKKLACDVRSSNAEGHVWDMVIERRANESCADLSWTITGLPDHYTAKWFDFTTNTVTDLLQNKTCKVSGQSIHKGKVIAGTASYVNNEIEEIRKTLPEKFALYPNFPNPFNPNTSIRFDIAKTGNVKLQIYNVLGQLVTTLINGTMETGKYDIQWNGKDTHGNAVSSGIYIYRIVTDGYVKARKMVLVR